MLGRDLLHHRLDGTCMLPQSLLQSRLQAGLDGFKEGYGQAYEQLSASGLLSDEVQAEIESTAGKTDRAEMTSPISAASSQALTSGATVQAI